MSEVRAQCHWSGRVAAAAVALTVEQLRRAVPSVPRERRICRFCKRQWAVENEMHVLLECSDGRLEGLRMRFMDDAGVVMGHGLGELCHRLSSSAFMDIVTCS